MRKGEKKKKESKKKKGNQKSLKDKDQIFFDVSLVERWDEFDRSTFRSLWTVGKFKQKNGNDVLSLFRFNEKPDLPKDIKIWIRLFDSKDDYEMVAPIGTLTVTKACTQKQGHGFLYLISQFGRKMLVDIRRITSCKELLKNCIVLEKGYIDSKNITKVGLPSICGQVIPYSATINDFRGITSLVRDLINEQWKADTKGKSGEMKKENEIDGKNMIDLITMGLFQEKTEEKKTSEKDLNVSSIRSHQGDIPHKKRKKKKAKPDRTVIKIDDSDEDEDCMDLDDDSDEKTPLIPQDDFFKSVTPKKKFVEKKTVDSNNDFGKDFTMVELNKKNIKNIRVDVPSIGNLIAVGCSSDFVMKMFAKVRNFPSHLNYICIILKNEYIEEYNDTGYKKSIEGILKKGSELWLCGDYKVSKYSSIFVVPGKVLVEMDLEDAYLHLFDVLVGCSERDGKINPSVKNLLEFTNYYEEFKKSSIFPQGEFPFICNRIFRKTFDEESVRKVKILSDRKELEVLSLLNSFCDTYLYLKTEKLLSFTPLLPIFSQKRYGRMEFIYDILFQIQIEFEKNSESLKTVVKEVTYQHAVYRSIIEDFMIECSWVGKNEKITIKMLKLLEGLCPFEFPQEVKLEWGLLIEFSFDGTPRPSGSWRTRSDLTSSFVDYKKDLFQTYRGEELSLGSNVKITNIPRYGQTSKTRKETIAVLLISNVEDFLHNWSLYPKVDDMCVGVIFRPESVCSKSSDLPESYFSVNKGDFLFFASNSNVFFTFFQNVVEPIDLFENVKNKAERREVLVYVSNIDYIEEIILLAENMKTVTIQTKFSDYREVIESLKKDEKLGQYFSSIASGKLKNEISAIMEPPREESNSVFRKDNLTNGVDVSSIRSHHKEKISIQNIEEEITNGNQESSVLFNEIQGLLDRKEKLVKDLSEKKKIGRELLGKFNSTRNEILELKKRKSLVESTLVKCEDRANVVLGKISELEKLWKSAEEELRMKLLGEVERNEDKKEKRENEERRRKREKEKREEDERRRKKEKREEDERRIKKEKREEDERRRKEEKEKREEDERRRKEERKKREEEEKRRKEEKEKREEDERRKEERKKREEEKKRRKEEKEKREEDERREERKKREEERRKREKREGEERRRNEKDEKKKKQLGSVRVPKRKENSFRDDPIQIKAHKSEEKGDIRTSGKLIIKLGMKYCIDCLDAIIDDQYVKCSNCGKYIHPWCDSSEEENEGSAYCEECFTT